MRFIATVSGHARPEHPEGCPAAATSRVPCPCERLDMELSFQVEVPQPGRKSAYDAAVARFARLAPGLHAEFTAPGARLWVGLTRA